MTPVLAFYFVFCFSFDDAEEFDWLFLNCVQINFKMLTCKLVVVKYLHNFNSKCCIWNKNERTSNPVGFSLDLLKYSSNWLDPHFFKHWTNSNTYIYWYSNSNTLFLASSDRTSNFKHCSTHPSLDLCDIISCFYGIPYF